MLLSSRLAVKRRFVVALAAAGFLGVAVLPAGLASAAGAQPFTFLAAGFSQSLYATGLPFAGGVAFAPNGNPLVGFGSLFNVDSHSNVTQNGSTIHPVTTFSSGISLGLANSRDGGVYGNTSRGVVKVNPTTGAILAGPFGAPGNSLGIALDPQTGHLVYAAADGAFHWVTADFASQGTFSTVAIGADGIAFDPTGTYLFTSSGGGLVVLDRSNNLVQRIALAGGACCTDGIAFHAANPRFVISNNTDGTITRFDFPGNDFTRSPTQSLLASGGFRGDLLQVGSDGCVYLTQGGTRFADGTVTSAGSLVRLCSGFAPPVARRFTDEVTADHPGWWWRLGEHSGTTMTAAAGGHSGNYQNGVVLGQPGAIAGDTAALFNGTSSYGYVNGITAPTTAYTMEIWMNATAPVQSGTLIDQGGAGALYVTPDRFCFRQTQTAICWLHAPTAGVWYHVVGTWDAVSGKGHLYVNGVERASAAAPSAPSGAGTLYVGYGQSAPWFKGYLDEALYYPTALSPTRVAAHYHAGCGC